MVMESENKKCSNICVGRVNNRLRRSTKVYVDREGETPVLKKWDIGGVVILGSRGFYQSRSKEFKTGVMWSWML